MQTNVHVLVYLTPCSSMLATKAVHNLYHTVTELHLQLHLQELLALVACHQCHAQI